ncbi:MAG: hypothetical protein AB8G05_23190 [Oligoflexales bacterium]
MNLKIFKKLPITFILILQISPAFGQKAVSNISESNADDIDLIFDELLEGKASLGKQLPKKNNPKTDFSVTQKAGDVVEVHSLEELSKIIEEIKKTVPSSSEEDRQLILRLSPDVAEAVTRKKYEQSYFGRFSKFFKNHALRLTSTVATFSLAFAFISPHVLAPRYSKWSGYSYAPIPFNLPAMQSQNTILQVCQLKRCFRADSNKIFSNFSLNRSEKF